jgi:hypothetical protein
MESAGADFDLIEVSGGPRFRPGESLAPGTALLISQLLASEAFSQLPKATHDTIKITF